MISRLSTRAPPLEAATVPIKNESLYTTFMVYFMDYRPPNIFIQRTLKLMKKRGNFTTHRSRNLYNPFSPFVLQNLRRMDSNHRPKGYEPSELPLLYLAIYLYDYKPTSPRSPIHVMRWLYQRV